MSIATVEKLTERARALTGEPALALYLGLSMRASAHGYLGFAAMSAATVGEALELAARFAEKAPKGEVTVVFAPGTGRLTPPTA